MFQAFGSRLDNVKFCWRLQKQLCGKANQPLILSNFLPILGFPTNLFWSLNHIFGRVRQILKLPQNLCPYIRDSIKFVLEVCQKAKSTLVRYGILAQCFLMPNSFEKCQSIFLRKRGKPKKSPPKIQPLLEFPISLHWSLSKA